MEPHVLLLFKLARAIVMDVDGVLTDGSLLISESGEQLRTMNIRDGYALQLAVKKGLIVAVITGGKSEGVVKRLNGLGIHRIIKASENKAAELKNIIEELKLSAADILYIGDDLPDLEAMKLCGIPCCPADACSEILAVSKYISPFNGGKGCVRDIVEKVLKLQNKWER